MSSEKWVNLNFPKKMYDEIIELFIDKEEYTTVPEFVRDLARQAIKEKKERAEQKELEGNNNNKKGGD